MTTRQSVLAALIHDEAERVYEEALAFAKTIAHLGEVDAEALTLAILQHALCRGLALRCGDSVGALLEHIEVARAQIPECAEVYFRGKRS